jgi:ankyrin repeat protein
MVGSGTCLHPAGPGVRGSQFTMTLCTLRLLVLLLAGSLLSDAATDRAFFAACRGDDVDAARRAAAAAGPGFGIDEREQGSGQTALMASVLAGADKAVEMLLSPEFNADASVPEKDGYTPMHGAGFQGRSTIASTLLKHGLDVDDVHAGDGLTPLWRTTWGSQQRHIDTATVMILEGRANVNFVTAKARHGEPHNALTSAVQRGNTRAISLLLKHGADPNQANLLDGNTALHFALKELIKYGGEPEIVKLLIELGGADMELKNKAGESARALLSKGKIDL